MLIATPAGKRPLTDLERCFLLILGGNDNISSTGVLISAKKFKICASCSNRSEVFFTGEKLIRKGLITRRLSSREYLWRLTRKGKSFLKQI